MCYPFVCPLVVLVKARLRAELYAARDEARSLERPLARWLSHFKMDDSSLRLNS